VKELLKIANLLFQATAKADEDDADEEASGGTAFALDASAFDVKTTRALASEITRLGATLHDALGEEERLRDARLSATRKNMDIEEIESQISEQIATVRENAANVERAMAELTEDESSLARQIERKRAELERSEKRLATLESGAFYTKVFHPPSGFNI
jgi:clusterin-associated protein 1